MDNCWRKIQRIPCHRFDVEIPRGMFAEITWKLWNRFDVDISTWNRLSKSIKYRWALHVEYSVSFRRQIDVTSVFVVSILTFSNIFFRCNYRELSGWNFETLHARHTKEGLHREKNSCFFFNIFLKLHSSENLTPKCT